MAPCIVFIDEIDTIGKSRDNRMGGNDEREQTLNQLLAEMDGFDPTKGVILLAATNRPEVLDQALLRPGRFDRRITIDRPNLAGRIATLQVHTRNIKLAEDVDLKKVALATAGCVGADLANLVNEAALRAVRKGRKLVTQEDLLAAFELVIAGTEKKGSVLTEFEKKLVAYHEVGHAMVAYKQKNTEPVQKITIVPHTQGSLGYTLLMPEEDKTELRTKDELMAKITVSMGGRAAEEVVMNTMTNGASQDIQDATNVARNMVAMFGMSDEFGMMALASRRNQYLDGGYGMDCAQDTAARMDQAVKEILDQCYKTGRGGHQGQPGGHGQGGGLPAGEGDHHRRGDGGHHRGPGPGAGGEPLRLHPGRGGRLPPLRPGDHRAGGQEGPHDLPEDRVSGGAGGPGAPGIRCRRGGEAL